MSTGRILFMAAVLIVVLAIPTIALSQSTTTVSGTVTYNDIAAPKSGARLYIRLWENSAIVFAETTPQDVGGKLPPYAFQLQIDSSRIRSNNTYEVEAIIAEDQQKRYQSQPRVRVLNGNKSTGLTILVTAASGTLPLSGSGSLRLLLALVLIGLVGALALWRRQRMRAKHALAL